MRRVLLCCFLLPFLLPIAPIAYANNRVALVIGNSNYSQGFLRNPINDATDINTVLTDLGFKVTLIKNGSRKAMHRAVQQFKAKLSAQTEVAFFFYAGHGAQFEGDSYLLPLKSSIASTADLPIEALKARDILTQMRKSGSRVNVMVLDACRNLPYPALKRSGTRGLARIEHKGSALIAYSTSLGNTAADGNGRNSPYTAVLKTYLPKKNLPLTQLFNDVGFEVETNTGRQQIPWVNSSPMPRVYLGGKGSSVVVNPPVVVPEVVVTPAPLAVVDTFIPPRQAYEPEMKFIRGGRFQMGSPASEKDRNSNEKQHTVQVGDFWMAKTETTFAQWQACVDDGGCQSNKKPDDEGWGRGNRPVINVSWHDANEYANWLSNKTNKKYRLPTEAQWEFAARGGTSSAFSFGNKITPQQANFDGNYSYNGSTKGRYLEKTASVGSYPANQYGLQDMHGNVWEWTCSAYDKHYGGSENKCAKRNEKRSRVLRGGSWNGKPRTVRSANRTNYTASNRFDYIGFRLSRTR